MLFNSFSFLIFFPFVTILYFLFPHRFRWILLLIASCIFYMAFVPKYILVLFFLILVDYLAGRFIERSIGHRRKVILLFSIFANSIILFFFKYFNFIGQNIAVLMQSLGIEATVPHLNILLPIGLSFHTFQSLSYVIEVYRGNFKAEKNLGIFALYVMFYPQLVAGPIERPQNLIHQFYERHKLDFVRINSGLRLILWGFFKKLVIADRLALIADAVYKQPTAYDTIGIIAGTIAFAYQIYCDFSGYTDIARGAARVMGFELMLNFNRPYGASSIKEFWQRWHISLTSWFRDYIYIPLGGNKIRIGRVYFNILIVFLISGLWHGANWTFIIWGGLHGLYLILSSVTTKARHYLVTLFRLQRLGVFYKAFRVLFVFILVCISWIFFRAKTVSEAFSIFSILFKGITYQRSVITGKIDFEHWILGDQSWKDFWFIPIALLLLEGGQWLDSKYGTEFLLARLPRVIRWLLYIIILWIIIIFGVFAERQFIYFVF